MGAAPGSGSISLSSAELLAALAISAVALMTLMANRISANRHGDLLNLLAGAVVASGAGIHALLHGPEAPHGGNALLAAHSSAQPWSALPAASCSSAYPWLCSQICAAALLLLGIAWALASLALVTRTLAVST